MDTTQKMPTLSDELAQMDLLRGCTPRSILACDAMWPETAPVGWSEAYMTAKARARLDAEDRHDGRTVAWLEGFTAACRLIEDGAE